MTAKVQAAIYVRISRDSELDGLGVKRQERDCRQLAEQLGWDVVTVYTDNDVSASSTKPRPEYERMMRAIEARQIHAVVVWDVDRLTRKPRELEDWVDHASALGLQLASVGGMVDLSTVQGRAMARMKGTFARMEAETTARRQRAKHKEMAEAGRYVGRRPYGYRFATDEHGTVLAGTHKRLVVDQNEAAVIRECARRVLDGEGLWSIMLDLNRRGIATSTGNEWRSQPLRRMLLRWVHAGYRSYTERRNGKPAGPEHLFEAGWEAIIDRDTHERVLAKLTDPTRVTNRGDTELKYLLTWLATCGACGGRLVGSKGYTYTVAGYRRVDGTRSPSKERTYPAKYICPHPECHGIVRRMDVVDEFVEAVIIRLLERNGVRAFGGDLEAVRDAQERIASIKAKRATLSDLLITPPEEGGLDDEQFRRQNATLKSQLDREEARLSAAQPAHDMDAYTGLGAAAAWAKATTVQKRNVLKALVEMVGLRVIIDPIGAGANSSGAASPHTGIRVESALADE